MADKKYELELNSKGYTYIAGTDEAGRGPIAGPLVVAAVVLPNDYNNPEIDDSKKLSPKKREELFAIIEEVALSFSIQVISLEEIEKYNIYEASRQGMIRCLKDLDKVDAILTDAMPIKDFDCPTIPLIHGDALSQTIAAASILAKVTRDRIMLEYDKIYPEYDFKNNMGYGTKKHLEALDKYGITPIHRRGYEPIKSMLNKQLKLDI